MSMYLILLCASYYDPILLHNIMLLFLRLLFLSCKMLSYIYQAFLRHSKITEAVKRQYRAQQNTQFTDNRSKKFNFGFAFGGHCLLIIHGLSA